MKRVIGFHGTNQTAFKKIIKNGFCGLLGQQIWNCSGGNNYFWSLDQMTEEENPIQEGFNHALKSSEVTLPFAAYNECRRVVIAVDLTGFEVSNDHSCNNMDGAVCVGGNIPVEKIICAWMDRESLAPLRVFLAHYHIKSKLACEPEFTGLERSLLKSLKEQPDLLRYDHDILFDMALNMRRVYFMANPPKWAKVFNKNPFQ